MTIKKSGIDGYDIFLAVFAICLAVISLTLGIRIF